MSTIYIAPKPVCDFTPEEYLQYVKDMYELRGARARSASPGSAASGLSVSRTKKGELTVRRTKARAFAYVTWREIELLAKQNQVSQADLWNMFKKKEYIVAKDRMEAEAVYASVNELPWGGNNATKKGAK